jgi:hypothetical protein
MESTDHETLQLWLQEFESTFLKLHDFWSKKIWKKEEKVSMCSCCDLKCASNDCLRLALTTGLYLGTTLSPLQSRPRPGPESRPRYCLWKASDWSATSWRSALRPAGSCLNECHVRCLGIVVDVWKTGMSKEVWVSLKSFGEQTKQDPEALQKRQDIWKN